MGKKNKKKDDKGIVSQPQMADVTSALWAIEDWCRSLREALLSLPPDTQLNVPEATLRIGYGTYRNGTIPMIKGCPPPLDECDEEPDCDEPKKPDCDDKKKK